MMVYTIYSNSSCQELDPFVVRQWLISPGQEPQPGLLECADNLEAARKFIPVGLTRVEPSPDDDPAVIESWL